MGSSCSDYSPRFLGGSAGGGLVDPECNPLEACLKSWFLILLSALLAQALLGVVPSKHVLVTSDNGALSSRTRLVAIMKK